MLFAWKIEYLIHSVNSMNKSVFEIQSVVVITDEYQFGMAESYFKLMFPDAKRIISIEYVCETAKGNLVFDPILESSLKKKLVGEVVNEYDN